MQSTFICIISFDSRGIYVEGRARITIPAYQIEKQRLRPWDLITERDRSRSCAAISQGMNGAEVARSPDLEPEGPGLSPGSFAY